MSAVQSTRRAVLGCTVDDAVLLTWSRVVSEPDLLQKLLKFLCRDLLVRPGDLLKVKKPF